MRKIFPAIAILLLMLNACGYTISRTGGQSGPPYGASKAAVPLFVNDTFEPLVEKDVTAALQEEIASDGRWVLVDRNNADVVVVGRVTQVNRTPLSYDAKERIMEYRLTIKSEIKVLDKTEKVLWKDNIDTYADYRVTEDVTKSKIRHGEAVRKASKNMAEEFIIKVLDTSNVNP